MTIEDGYVLISDDKNEFIVAVFRRIGNFQDHYLI